jgi:uroporphyrinogen decarboxylase
VKSIKENEMTHRQRVMAALNHQETDRVPMDLGGSLASGLVGEGYPGLRKELGLPVHEAIEAWRYTALAEIEEDVRQALDVDILHAPRAFGSGDAVTTISADRFMDEWGVQWHKPQHGHYYVEKAPFEDQATPEAVERHVWLEPKKMLRLEGFKEKLKDLRTKTDYAISLEIRGRILSLGQFLRGFENWMMDLAGNEDFVTALLERTTQLQIECNELLLREVGDLVDIVYTSDDLGAQGGPLCSPGTFNRLLKPHFKKLWAHVRATSPAKLMHHCCGSIYPFIGDFIEMGVQALNPIQVSAANMDPVQLKKDFGKHLTFWGGVDTRDVLPRGNTTDVRNEVELRIRQMAKGGGYILAAVHNLQPEVPPANIVALFKAGKESSP